MVASLVQAQTGLGDMQRGVGVTSGDAISVSNVGMGTAGTYKLAAVLEAEQLQNYIGCDVVGIRFALGQDMARSAVLLNTIDPRTHAITNEVFSQTVRYPSEGWNNIFFNGAQKHTITAGESLMFGFEYTETATMVENDEGAICINGQNTSGNGFYIYGNFGQGEGWYSSNTGNVCVQLIVDVTNMPAEKLEFAMFTSGHKYKKTGDIIDFLCVVENAGRDNMASLDYSVYIDNEKVGEYLFENNDNASAVSLEQKVSLPSDIAMGEHSFSLSIDRVNGHDVSIPAVASENFVLYESSLVRQKHYLEQYKNQSSLYNQHTDKIMSEVAKNPKACLVNVYDSNSVLAVDEALPLVSRYAYCYPCFTVDRSYYPGELHVAYDVNDYAEVVPEIMVGVINQIVAEQDYYPAFATVDIDADYESASRKLNITVTGDLISGAKQLFGNNAVLTVMLTENNVKSVQTVSNSFGGTKRDTSYLHHNVLRQFVTDAEGDALDLDNAAYRKDYSVVLPDNIKADDVEVVAFVSRGIDCEVTPININNFDISNCNSIALKSVIDGIVQVESTPLDDACYNLAGQKVTDTHRGILIRGGRKFIKQ